MDLPSASRISVRRPPRRASRSLFRGVGSSSSTGHSYTNISSKSSMVLRGRGEHGAESEGEHESRGKHGKVRTEKGGSGMRVEGRKQKGKGRAVSKYNTLMLWRNTLTAVNWRIRLRVTSRLPRTRYRVLPRVVRARGQPVRKSGCIHKPAQRTPAYVGGIAADLSSAYPYSGRAR